MDLRFLASHHLPDEDGGGSSSNPTGLDKATRFNIQSAPDALIRMMNQQTRYQPAVQGEQYGSNNNQNNAAFNKLLRDVREATSGEGIDEKRGLYNINNNVIRNLDAFDKSKFSSRELDDMVKWLYKNKDFTIDETGEMMPYESEQDNVVTRQNKKASLHRAQNDKEAGYMGLNQAAMTR